MLRCLYPSFPAVCLRRWTAISQFMSTNRALQPPLPAALRPYEDVMKLLAAFSGPNCEVVLHDLSDPVHSVVRVENGEVTGRAVGQGLRHLVPNLLRMSRTDDGALSSESPNLLPVYWLRSRGRLIRALSLLIRDDAGEVIGVLCINQDVTNVSAAAGQLQALLALLPARRGFHPSGGIGICRRSRVRTRCGAIGVCSLERHRGQRSSKRCRYRTGRQRTQNGLRHDRPHDRTCSGRKVVIGRSDPRRTASARSLHGYARRVSC